MQALPISAVSIESVPFSLLPCKTIHIALWACNLTRAPNAYSDMLLDRCQVEGLVLRGNQ